jgi:hypothetical protein
MVYALHEELLLQPKWLHYSDMIKIMAPNSKSCYTECVGQ